MTPPPLIQARRIGCVTRGLRILRDVDLTVSAGERLAVMGPSGSGKSTLLAMLAGLLTPSEGEILLDGQRVTGVAGPERGVAIVLQGYGLVSLLTAAENVEVALMAAGRSHQEAQKLALASLAEVGLAGHADQVVEELSGGQQQRTAVARALALQPRLLIADEPTAEQDPVTRTLVMARMLAVSDRGGGLVLATHDPDVAGQCHHTLDLQKIPSPVN